MATISVKDAAGATQTAALVTNTGSTTAANSLPVVIASDQAAVPVSGPLTDAQLRAGAVPVSGPLTDAQLRATSLPTTPNTSRGAGAVDSTTTRVTVASDAPIMATLGAPADAAAASDGATASLIALVKRLLGKLPGQGQALAAASQPVVIASDQSAVPVTATDLATLVARTPPLGAAAPTAATPVVMSNDVTVTGPTAQSAINVDLLTGTVNGWYDAGSFQSGSIQIIASAGISAGAITFEQTNDTTSAPAGVALRAYEASLINSNPNVAAIPIAASTARIFTVPVNSRFIRVRISTAFVGGTVQAVGTFSQRAASFPVVNVQQATAANLNATVSGTVTANIGTGSLAAGTNAIGDVGTQYRASAAGAASVYQLVAAGSTNAVAVKASAGRLLGWTLGNTSAAWRYVKLHNQATLPTAGTGVVATIAIPPGGQVSLNLEGGIAFSTGIGITTVTGSATTDATAVTAGDLVGNLFFA